MIKVAFSATEQKPKHHKTRLVCFMDILKYIYENVIFIRRAILLPFLVNHR
jgi:hypothetical protein